MLLLYLSQQVIGLLFGGKKQPTPPTGNSVTDAGPDIIGSDAGSPSDIPSFFARPPQSSIKHRSVYPHFVAPIWDLSSDIALDIQIYVSPSPHIKRPLRLLSPETKVLDEKSLRVGDYEDTREIVVPNGIRVPPIVQRNGTLWAHFYVALAGGELDPLSDSYDPAFAYFFRRPLNQYLPKKRAPKLKNLLSSDEEQTGDDDDDEGVVEEQHASRGTTIASYYHPNFTVSVVPDTAILNLRQIHPSVPPHVQLEQTHARDASGRNGWYYPIIYFNTFWQLRSHMTEINSTVERLPLRFTLNNFSNWKFTIMASMDDAARTKQKQAMEGGLLAAGGDGSEFEMMKELLLDTNVYLLATTAIVSLLHTVFEMLAFKNDIAHWRKKKDVVGTSVRSILANVLMQLVIFLYLFDNSDGTSFMILAGQGFSIVLEAWKVTKSVDVRIRPPRPGSRLAFLPYHIVFEDKHKLSETEKRTKQYDEIAFNYLYIIAIPLLAAYAAYSLVYESHKSWYSFVIATLVGSVYAYGFLMMVPSLYINYRLKSVAHMPGKALTYKFLNTFIDDLFAFTIKMPTLHRLATLRDDVIFFVWLYQAYAYRVDYKRVNEFGQGGESDEEEEKEEVVGEKVVGESSATGQSKGSEEAEASVRRRA